MKLLRRELIVGLYLSMSSFGFAQKMTLFTPAEQQQISIATAGLFEQKNSFDIDFNALDDKDYSFPLPVGKATLVNGQTLNIETVKGDAVKAMFDGAVRMSRKTPQYGNVVVVRHDNGLETVYGYNAQNLVKVGQRVKAGQTIAIVGENDGKYACMFAIMVNGGWINPSIIIDPVSHRLRKAVINCRKALNHVDVSVAKTEGKTKLTLDPNDPNNNGRNGKTVDRVNLDDLSNDSWAYPLPGGRVISDYGGRRNHAGVDLKTKPNDKIVAAFDGVVSRSGPFSGYGNCIVIRHAHGIETLYGHQSKNLVKVGDRVKAGQVIGLTGRTGRATTEHLHFEIKVKGHRLNPAVIFNHAARKLKSVTIMLAKGVKVLANKK